MASKTPRKVLVIDEETGNGGGAWDTIAQIEAGSAQPLWIDSVVINTTSSDSALTYGVRLQRQGASASGDMSSATPGDLNLSWGFDGTALTGSIGVAGGSEPTAYSGAGGAVVAEEYRTVGGLYYREFYTGELIVPAGGWLGLQVKESSGLTYTGEIRFVFHADS